MDKEDIKKAYSMRRIVERYGLYPNKTDFIPCPFHGGDREASMKIYPDSFYCFACGASGDIFSFVQRIDNCDFKTAFYSLGGTYEKPSFESKLALYRQRQKETERRKTADKLRKRRETNNHLIDVYRDYMNRSEPFSEVWCDCCNALQYQLYIHELLNKKR